MKTFAILFAGTAALALGACGSADDTADDAADVTVIQEPDAPAPTVTETTVVREADDADSVTVGPDGVKVDVDSNGTRVKADSDGASVTVSE